jgi:hypothetical protein
MGNPFLKHESVYYYDFPSMYLNIMGENLFPTGKLQYSKKPTNINDIGFYRCKVFSNMKIPVLPTKIKNNNNSD